MPPFFQLITRYFPQLSERQTERFLLLWDFYREWNSKINVISRKDIDELYLKHVLHSLSVAHFFRFHGGISILDIGTGGGFPGIPLSIFFEDAKVTMVDSIGKKIQVVQKAIALLQLSNAVATHIRAEDLKQQYDFVVCRAVADSSELISWTHKLIKYGKTPAGQDRGLICLKGGDLTEEMSKVRWKYKIFEIKQVFQEEFFETKKIVHFWK